MANKAYVGVSGTPQKIKEIYVGVNGTPHRVIKGYVGVNGQPRLFWKRRNPWEFDVNVVAKIKNATSGGGSFNVQINASIKNA